MTLAQKVTDSLCNLIKKMQFLSRRGGTPLDGTKKTPQAKDPKPRQPKPMVGVGGRVTWPPPSSRLVPPPCSGAWLGHQNLFRGQLGGRREAPQPSVRATDRTVRPGWGGDGGGEWVEAGTGNCGRTYSLDGLTQRDSNVCVCSGTNNEILEHCNGISAGFNERL